MFHLYEIQYEIRILLFQYTVYSVYYDKKEPIHHYLQSIYNIYNIYNELTRQLKMSKKCKCYGKTSTEIKIKIWVNDELWIIHFHTGEKLHTMRHAASPLITYIYVLWV